MSKCKEVPWTGTGHAESTREVFPITVFSQLVFGDLRKKPLSWPGKELCGVRATPAHRKIPLPCLSVSAGMCVSPHALEPQQAGSNSAGTGPGWIPPRGPLPSHQSPWLHVTAPKRLLPRAAFLPVTTPPWVFQACLLCIDTLNFYGACSALGVNHPLHPAGLKEGRGRSRGRG